MNRNTTGDDADAPQDFGHALGDALKQFLAERGLGPSEAAKQMGLDNRGGARLWHYLNDKPNGARSTPDAEILFLLCAKLRFSFEYSGFLISAQSPKKRKQPTPQEQLTFDRQFNLSDQQGIVDVSVKRPADRIEVAVSLKARA